MEFRREAVTSRPRGTVARFVERYVGYRYAGFTPGIHRGLPSSRLTFMVSFDQPVVTMAAPDPTQVVGPLQGFVCGLAVNAAEIADAGHGHGVAIELTPLAARTVLGISGGDLSSTVVELSDLMPRRGRELVERLVDAEGWPARFDILDEILGAELHAASEPAPQVVQTWSMMTRSGPSTSINAIAEHVGWSRRYLAKRFRDEVGLSPRQLRRVIRLERSAPMLLAGLPHAHVAVEAGYFDQAHLIHDWQSMVRCAPTQWLSEEIPSLQDARPHELQPSGG